MLLDEAVDAGGHRADDLGGEAAGDRVGGAEEPGPDVADGVVHEALECHQPAGGVGYPVQAGRVGYEQGVVAGVRVWLPRAVDGGVDGEELPGGRVVVACAEVDVPGRRIRPVPAEAKRGPGGPAVRRASSKRIERLRAHLRARRIGNEPR